MIELGRHIEILLLGNDCVIVPGLGAFVAHHVAARYDEHDGVYLPPLRTVGFNPKYVMNDSLLAQSYVEANDTSYPEAVAMVESDVRALRRQLTDEGFVELNGVGTLTVNKEGNLEFLPNEAGILTPDLYALGGLDIQPLAAIRSKHNVAPASAPESTAAPLHQQQEATAKAAEPQTKPITISPRTQVIGIASDRNTGKRFVAISLSAIRNTAVAALLATAFFLLASPLDLNKGGRHIKQLQCGFLCNVFDVGKSIKPDFLFKPIITTAGKSDKAISHVAKPASKPAKAKAAPKPKPVAAAPQPKEYWSIVLCSRVGLKNAEIYAEMIHKDGFSEAVVIDKETNAKVVYGKYPSKEEAQNALRQLRDNKYFKIGWLLKITE